MLVVAKPDIMAPHLTRAICVGAQGTTYLVMRVLFGWHRYLA